MGLMIIGLIILITGIVIGKSQAGAGKFKGIVIGAGILVLIIGLLTSTIRQIDTGRAGIKVLFGEVEPDVLYEGLNFVNPFLDIKELSLQTQNYTMSATYEEGKQTGDDAVRVLSKDGLEVTIDMTILYKILPSKAPGIYKKIGSDYEDKVIRPQTRTRIREVAVYYNATDLYTEKRVDFETKIKLLLEKDFAERGFVLEQMLVRKVKLPKSVEESIERKITAVQEAQRMEFVLQKEKQEAERKRVEAQGVADAQKIVNLGLSDKILQFEMIKVQKELVNSPNSKIIIMGNGKNTAPFIIGNEK